MQAFTDERPHRTLPELADELDLRKTTAHRILSGLEQKGFLSRGPQGAGYRLGPELIVLGARALRAVDIREVALPELKAMAKDTGDDLTLECGVGWEVLLLHEERGQSMLGLGSAAGTLWPAHATSTGKVLMAYADEPVQPPEGGLKAVTEYTTVSWEDWTATLDKVRREGFATSMEELEYGYAAVAAPVRDQTGRPTAAISIGGPLHRVNQDRIPELAEIVKAGALRISERLGYRKTEGFE